MFMPHVVSRCDPNIAHAILLRLVSPVMIRAFCCRPELAAAGLRLLACHSANTSTDISRALNMKGRWSGVVD
jgi:hypothetical protein